MDTLSIRGATGLDRGYFFSLSILLPFIRGPNSTSHPKYQPILASHCTLVYTHSMYNVPEFRANLKKAFDEALSGGEVRVERGGVIYKLVPLNVMPTHKEYVRSWNEGANNHPGVPRLDEKEYNFCKHDQIKGLCKKGCK